MRKWTLMFVLASALMVALVGCKGEEPAPTETPEPPEETEQAE